MAEVTGQIGTEYVELDNAATEATLQELLKATLSAAKVSKINVKDAQQEINRLYKNSKKLNPQLLRQAAETRKSTAQLKKSEAERAKALEDTEKAYRNNKIRSSRNLKDFGVTVGDTITKMFSFANNLANIGDSLSSAASAYSSIPVVGGILSSSFGAIAGQAERLFKGFQTSAAVGATFSGSVTEMVNSAGQAGLTFDQFANIISKNAPGLALLGNGVDSGARRFADLSKQMRGALVNEGLANLGYSAETANEAMAGYVSRLARTGHAQNMSVRELTESSTNYLKNLDALSKLTGQSKDQLQAEADARQNDARFRALLSKADVDSRAELDRLMASVPAGMRSGAMEVLATGTATTEAGQQFLAFMGKSGQAFIQTGEMVRRGGQLTVAATNGLIDGMTAESRELANSPVGDTLARFVPEMNDFMVAAFDASQRAADVGKLREETDRAAAQATDDLANSVVNAKMQLAEFSNEIAVILANNIGLFRDVLDITIKFIRGALVPVLSTVADHFGKITVLLVGLAAAITAAKVAKGASSLMGSAGGRGSKNSGKRGSVGTGAARGLMAFANPKILIGAGVIAGVITVIGAAIAGAAWLTGKALPTFSEGLKSFENLDGQKLGEVGSGIAKLSAGLAAFGAGGVVGALGNIASNIVGGLNSLFGGQTPFDKLEEFSRLNIDSERVKNNAEALSAFSLAMAKAGGGGASSAVGTALESVVSFFRGGSSIAALQKQIIEFQSLNFDKTKIDQNANGITAFIDALAVASNQTFIESLNSLRTLSSGGLFSKSPLEKLDAQLIQYQKLSADKNRIDATAAGLKSFVQSINEVGAANFDISSTMKLEKGTRDLRNINKELAAYRKNLVDIQKETPKTAQVQTPATQAPTAGSQEQIGSLMSSLNTKLDQLISINSSIRDINDRQLRVQRNSDPLFNVP